MQCVQAVKVVICAGEFVCGKPVLSNLLVVFLKQNCDFRLLSHRCMEYTGCPQKKVYSSILGSFKNSMT